MAAAAAAVAINQQAVVNAFMRTDAVRPAQAILFEPKGYLQRSYFDSLTKAGVLKPEGSRWFLDIPAYHEVKRRQRTKALIAAGLLTVGVAIAALL